MGMCYHYIMAQGCCIMSKVEKCKCVGRVMNSPYKIQQGSLDRTVGVNVSLFPDPGDKAAAAAANNNNNNNSSSCQQKTVILSCLR